MDISTCYICSKICDKDTPVNICLKCIKVLRNHKKVIANDFCSRCGRKRKILFSGINLCPEHCTRVESKNKNSFPKDLNELSKICGTVLYMHIKYIQKKEDGCEIHVKLYCEKYNLQLTLIMDKSCNIELYDGPAYDVNIWPLLIKNKVSVKDVQRLA